MPHTSTFFMESVESSVQKLIKYRLRRQRWRQQFYPRDEIISTTNEAPWRTHLANFLDSSPTSHILTISLLLMDLTLTILELSFSLTPSCGEENRRKRVQERWFHRAGLAILGLLAAKTIALALGLGSSFFKKAGNVVDGVVVIGALGLEIGLVGKGGGFLLLVSLWRVVRVIESAFELSDDAIEARIEEVISEFEVLKEDNARLVKVLADRDNVIKKLEQEMAGQINQC